MAAAFGTRSCSPSKPRRPSMVHRGDPLVAPAFGAGVIHRRLRVVSSRMPRQTAAAGSRPAGPAIRPGGAMRRLVCLAFTAFFAFATGSALTGGPALADAHSEMKPSLYKRLGGYDALAAVTDDFIGRMATDPSWRVLRRPQQGLAGAHPAARRRPALRRHRRPVRLHRPRHEDLAPGHGHHRGRLEHRGRPPRGHTRQVQGAGKGEGEVLGARPRH